jgi:hypothetical protein
MMLLLALLLQLNSSLFVPFFFLTFTKQADLDADVAKDDAAAAAAAPKSRLRKAGAGAAKDESKLTRKERRAAQNQRQVGVITHVAFRCNHVRF